MIREEKIALIKALKAKEALLEDQKIRDIKLSLVQGAFVCSKAKIRFLLGANRAGKSLIGALDIIIAATGVIPKCIESIYPREKIRYGEYWVSSLDFPSSVGITQKKINEFLPRRMSVNFSKEFRIHSLATGSKIGYKSAESGREKYQGESKLGFWMDEEHDEAIYSEGYMRTTDCEGFLTTTFTPLKGLTWSYSKLYLKAGKYIATKNKHGIKEDIGIIHTLEEIELLRDRELVTTVNGDANADPDIEVFQMSIYDNLALPIIEIQRAERRYVDNPVEYNARILGKFSKINGKTVFDQMRLAKLQNRTMAPLYKADIEDGKLVVKANGRLSVYKDKKPYGKGFYVIGADSAEGNDDGDFSDAQILDRETCEQVAVWHGHISPEEFAKVLDGLGRYYNLAFLGPERNFHGVGIVERLRNTYKYPRLYCRYDVAQEAVTQGTPNKVKKYGWDTNLKTKPIMIQTLGAYLREEHVKINDFNTVEELTTYVYDKDGKTGAMQGCFDDRVVALAIAIQMFELTPLMKTNFDLPGPEEYRMSKDMGY